MKNYSETISNYTESCWWMTVVFVHQRIGFYVVSCECELWKINCKQIFQPWFGLSSRFTRKTRIVVRRIYLLLHIHWSKKMGINYFDFSPTCLFAQQRRKKSFSERSPHFANFCGYLLLKESYVWISIHLFNSVIYYFFRCQPVGSLG